MAVVECFRTYGGCLLPPDTRQRILAAVQSLIIDSSERVVCAGGVVFLLLPYCVCGFVVMLVV